VPEEYTTHFDLTYLDHLENWWVYQDTDLFDQTVCRHLTYLVFNDEDQDDLEWSTKDIYIWENDNCSTDGLVCNAETYHLYVNH